MLESAPLKSQQHDCPNMNWTRMRTGDIRREMGKSLQDYIKNYRKLHKAGGESGSSLGKSTPIGCPVPNSSENSPGHIIKTVPDTWRYTYTTTYMSSVTMSGKWGHEFEEEWEGYMGVLRRKKTNGRMLSLNYNLKISRYTYDLRLGQQVLLDVISNLMCSDHGHWKVWRF